MALLAVTLRLLLLIGAACLCNTGCLLFWLQIKSLVENTTAERHKETGEMEKKTECESRGAGKSGQIKGRGRRFSSLLFFNVWSKIQGR